MVEELDELLTKELVELAHSGVNINIMCYIECKKEYSSKYAKNYCKDVCKIEQ